MAKSQKKSHCKDKMVVLALKIFIGLALLAGIGAVVLTSRHKMQETLFDDAKETANTLNDMVVVPPQARRNKKSFAYQPLGGPWQNIRLSKDIVPQHYDLKLNIDMDKEAYSGSVNILVNVTQTNTRYILLHKVKVTVKLISILDLNGHKLDVLQTFENALNEYLVIEMRFPLIQGTQLKIGLNFAANLRTDLTGLFITRKGNSKMAATFLSPISTRKFFPCFDEPDFKATFSVKVTHSSQYKALSNMPVASQTTVQSQTTTEFKKTLPMSTYHLGLLIADHTYQVKEKRTVGTLTIQIWDYTTNPGWKSETEEIVKLLNYYERHFFKLPFPLEKLDVVVLPDYIPGAMETWGLMMFRVSLRNYHLMVHEIAHQWFGNLVTMEFWNEAWIKEGFAQYLATIVGDTVKNTQRYKNQFFGGMSRALPMDSYATSHPIVPEIKVPTDIRNVYDNIVYYKGEPVVHILSTLVGMENFRKGMKRFLQLYKYKNAKQDDLFRVMGDISGIDVKSFMDPWLLQMGYPLLTVNRLNKTHIEVEQERFSMDAPNTALTTSPFNYQWPIIVTYRSLNDVKTKQKIMTGKREILAIPDGSVLNPDHMQYYRIRFSKNTTAQLKKQLIHNQGKFSVNDRIGIISDMFFNLQARKMKLEQVIDFMEYFKHEREHSPWTEGIKILTKVHDLIKHNDKLRNLWDNKIIQPYVERAYSLFKNKGKVIGDACYLNHTKAIQESEQYAKSTYNLDERVCCALRHDKTKEQKLWQRFHTIYLSSPKTRGFDLSYLACTMNKTQLTWLFQYTLSLAHTNPGDATYYLQFMMRSDAARDTAWEFIQKNWAEYDKRYSKNTFLLKELISSVVPLFRTSSELQQVEQFYNKKQHTLGTGKVAFDQAISEIKMHIELTRVVQLELNNAGKNSFRNPFLPDFTVR